MKEQILKGRKAVDAYRLAHAQLHSKGWYKGISEEHTPLLEEMVNQLSKQGFNSVDEFFGASDELNLQELELDADFQAKFCEANKDAKKYIDEEGNKWVEDTAKARLLKREALGRMWH